MQLSRRDFFKISSAAGLVGVIGSPGSLSARPLEMGGRGFSSTTGKEMKRIPSACWQCVTRDGIIGYVEDGRLKKIEGNPELPRTSGKLCARGHAGMNIVYDPDRVLFPLQRVGRRGEGKWKKISWDAALDLLIHGGTIAGRRVKGLQTLRDEGNAHHFMFHYGRMKGSDSKIIKTHFLAAYGTKTIGNHTSICESAKWTAHELTWGSHYDSWDLENTRFILNFGSNVFEAHTNHVPLAQRGVEALARGVKMYTFDVRLSNTAARSTEWIPIRSGTDLAVVLAMANVLMKNDLYDRDFIETYTNVSVVELKKHLAQYTPAWAEKISTVPAAKIETIALEYGRNKPSVCLSYRGAVAHYNGVETERAIMMLEAIAGNIDRPGGRCRAVGAKWKYPFPKPRGKAKKLHILDGEKGAYAYPTHHASHQVLPMIDKGPERPEIYMTYCYNPAYVNGDCRANVEVLKDEQKIPFTVAVDVALSETTQLADLVLPDATYLERWTCDDMVCPSQIAEYYIRQPMHAPLGQARNFCDVVCDIAKRMGLDLGFGSAEEFVKAACNSTPGVKEAGGFEHMRQHGAWYDKSAKPKYFSHVEEVDVSGATLDEATGVYYKKHEGDKDYSSLKSKAAAKQYVAQQCGDGKARRGFPPDSHKWKTGIFEIRSQALAKKGFNAIPAWMPIPEHEKLGEGELVLTTYKVNVQSHSRTQNARWLTELYHRNPAWINAKTAASLGIADEDEIVLTSSVGSITTRARVTEGIQPDVIAISNHCGHWAYGEYASLEGGPDHVHEAGCKQIWWDDNGVHPNWIMPAAGDPIGGQHLFMDTLVKVRKA